MSEAWPTELRVKDKGRILHVAFDSGEKFEIAAELLRVESPSAEVKGHGPGQETLVFGKRDIAITGVEPVGSYAARLIFSDGHATGLYTWPLLHRLGLEAHALWAAYEAKLKAAGKSRNP